MKYIFLLLLILIVKPIKAQWTSINYPLPGEEVGALVYVDDFIIAGTGYDNGIIYRTSNLGGSWEVAVSGLNGSVIRDLFAYKEPDTTFIYAATDSGLFSSTNYGTSWNELTLELTDKNINTIYRTENHIFAGADSMSYRSTDKGFSWNAITIDSLNSNVSEFLRSGNNFFACLLVSSGNLIYKSEDFGLTWTPTESNLGSSTLSSLEKLNGRLFYLTYSAMFQSTNDGASWERIGPFTWYPSEFKSYGEYLFIGSLIPEMYKIHTDSTSINALPGNTPPFQFVSAMDINLGLIVAAAADVNNSGYGIWIRKTSDITSVEENNSSPVDFYLGQNYPNPFNPSTKIKYTIPVVETWHASSLQTTLKVYDVLGNEIAILVNAEKSEGTYEIEWNASGLSSGIYFYQMTVGDFKETKKMLMIK